MAANLIYTKPGAAITLGSNSDTVHRTPKNIATGAGRISDAYDRGAGARPSRYRWRLKTKWAATPTLLDYVFVYLITSSQAATPAMTDGGFTFGDAALATNLGLIYNCQQIGGVYAEAADQAFSSGGICYIYDRYCAVACWMVSATKALTNTDADHQFSLIPIPDEVQAAA
jgi:hypothetical protein